MNRENDNGIGDLVRDATITEPNSEYADGLEDRLRALTLCRRKERSQMLAMIKIIGGAAAAIAVCLLLLVGETNETGVQQGQAPLATVILAAESNEESADEKRQCLFELVDTADTIIGGKIRKARGNEKSAFVCDVLRVLKGDVGPENPSIEQVKVFGCPEPPTFRADVYVVLFLWQGIVLTDQWKAEFDTTEAMQLFCDRVELYVKGEAAPLLASELAAGKEDFPYHETDRLLMDLALFEDKRCVPGLIDFVKAGLAGDIHLIKAMRILGNFNDRTIIELCEEIVSDEGSNEELREAATRCLDKYYGRLRRLGYVK